MRDKVGVGLLLDETLVRLSFSMFAGPDGIPLPVTLDSPVLTWRKGPILVQGTCVVLCLVLRFVMARVTLDLPEDPESTESSDVTSTLFLNAKNIKIIAQDLDAKRFKMKQQGDVSYSLVHELARKVEALESQIRVLTTSYQYGIPLMTPHVERWPVDDEFSTPNRKQARHASRCYS